MVATENIFEIRLSEYQRLRDTEDGTRLAISDVFSETSHRAFPATLSGSVERLVQNVNKEPAANRSQSNITKAFTSTRDQATQPSFIGTPKLKGDHMSLLTDFDYTDVAIQLQPLTRYVRVQSSNLFDLTKPHPLNNGALDMFLERVRDYEPMTGDELRDFVMKTQQQYCRLRNQESESARLQIVLAGITNLQSIHKTYYSPLGKEVRDPAILIHGIQINGEWQNLSDYKDLTPSGPQSARLFTLANLYSNPIIFLDIDDDGKSFLENAELEAQKLANDDWLRRATNGLVFTPSPKSGLPNDERFWFKVPGAIPMLPSWAGMATSPRATRKAAEEARQDGLRREAQAFADKLCTEETFERAWNVVTRNMRCDEVFPKENIRQYMAAVWQIEHIVADEEEWVAVDRTKVQPRIDRRARAWIMAKLERPDITGSLDGNDGWVDVGDDDTALELTLAVRE
ncbi:hypothetical protein CLAFUW4_02896 [Fulvia fulva]|uniref:Uncharacterized protein n=1 Tax=Passalora fulva TaxID=5499 RepID=A0A9Q8LBP0_PASFU|nr:uncharacterized protein CLAFUR5_02884 [Fulvia fulva]KAK4631731.1 hypothetical protein CLAFUR4_02889 [Fulvia fulva]KAK4633802.1 hypothetical protein CLAFUR0_02892 [Fulvia fulva]UJO14463.1 hypothetical protein CLAFUR5_02884 [Fulvia fulva]WPV11490.1 hypothetical protein CLAFUW4_02896 [Fulvia fulva]WPV26898.1 hypothetical protein CLAFUW7_02893 [Fulvia fulva]